MAGFIDGLYTGSVDNQFEDQSREAFIDSGAGNVGTIGVGDSLVGFLRIDNKSAPNSISLNNQVYAIFSQTIAAQFGSVQALAPNATPGLRISDFVPGAPATAIAAVFSSAVPITDLITTNPPPGATAKMSDYISHITSNMTLEFVAGFADPDDFWTAIATFPVTADNNPATGAVGLGTGITVATYSAGLSIFDGIGASSAVYNDSVVGFDVLTGLGGLYQLAVSGGSASGSGGVANRINWSDASGFAGGPYQQCDDINTGGTQNLPCGFTDKANFTVNPSIPEPGSLALLGLGLLGFAGIRRRLNSN
jgi:hypothetical protein